MRVDLLKFPYPFKAALSICSDIDGTSIDNFIQIHKYLNSTQPTSMGNGLGLPISDSFWMYDFPGAQDSAFSYFSGDKKPTPGPSAPLIREFIQAGILDTMHAYGNFINREDFSRHLAETALEELDKHKLKLRVWTNHGGVQSAQNIGERSAGFGDIPDYEYYHADLLQNYGIRFFWDTERSLMTNIGQNGKASFADAYWSSPLYAGGGSRLKSILKGIASLGDLFMKKMCKQHFVPWEIFDPKNNQLISSDTLRDDSNCYRFRRTGLGNLDWSDHIPILLSEAVVNKLIKSEGAMILYVHMGDRLIRDDKQALSTETIATMQRIAEIYHSGRLWISGTSQLLNYSLISKYLDWHSVTNEYSVKIIIRNTLKTKNHETITAKDLAGITFAVSGDHRIDIKLENDEVTYRKHLSGDNRTQYLQIPLTKIDWPL